MRCAPALLHTASFFWGRERYLKIHWPVLWWGAPGGLGGFRFQGRMPVLGGAELLVYTIRPMSSALADSRPR